MGYLDKVHKKIEAEKLAKKLMDTDAYKEAKKKDQEQAALQAYASFCIIACDFLELRHRYKKKGLMKFLAFASQRLKYVEENQAYFVEMNDMFRDEMELDVLATLGLKFEGGEVSG